MEKNKSSKLKKSHLNNDLDNEFIDIFKEVSIHQGFDHLMSEIFALIYISPEEVTLEDISIKTKYSLASISNKIKFMEELGLINKYTKPGSKKIYLNVERNIFKLSRDNLLNQKNKSLLKVKELMPNLIEKYKQNLSQENKQKLKYIEDYYQQMILSEQLIDNLVKEFDKLIEN